MYKSLFKGKGTQNMNLSQKIEPNFGRTNIGAPCTKTLKFKYPKSKNNLNFPKTLFKKYYDLLKRRNIDTKRMILQVDASDIIKGLIHTKDWYIFG